MRLGEVVVIDEVMPGVVGRVDVDELDLARIGLAHELECLKVITLDVEVLGFVPVHALAALRTHSFVAWRAGQELGFSLARPSKLIPLALPLGDITQEVA